MYDMTITGCENESVWVREGALSVNNHIICANTHALVHALTIGHNVTYARALVAAATRSVRTVSASSVTRRTCRSRPSSSARSEATYLAQGAREPKCVRMRRTFRCTIVRQILENIGKDIQERQGDVHHPPFHSREDLRSAAGIRSIDFARSIRQFSREVFYLLLCLSPSFSLSSFLSLPLFVVIEVGKVQRTCVSSCFVMA